MKNIFITSLFLLLFSCKNEEKKMKIFPSDHIKIDWLKLQDDYYGQEQQSLKDLKAKYPLFFPDNVPDTVWDNKRKDSAQLVLFKKSKEIFKGYKKTDQDLKQLFAQATKIFSNFKIPKVVPLISDLDEENKIILAKEYLILATDMYLGGKDEVYQSFPNYLSNFYDINYLDVDIAKAISQKYHRRYKARTFVEKMIELGKEMAILDYLLPLKDDADKIHFTADQYSWAKENERQVWMYFLDKEVLFSANNNLNQRFLETAPFSKFYLSTDRETPGRIGVYIGWQIVKRYQEKNGIDLKTLLKTPPMEIYTKANYKAK